MKRKNEIWALEVKVDGLWKLATWYAPRIPDDRDSIDAGPYTKETAKKMSDKNRQYRAVRYVRASACGSRN